MKARSFKLSGGSAGLVLREQCSDRADAILKIPFPETDSIEQEAEVLRIAR